MLAPDIVVHGRYRITRPIGRGGMGAVYEAVDERLGNRIALKQTIVEGPQADRAFEREAMYATILSGPTRTRRGALGRASLRRWYCSYRTDILPAGGRQ